MVAKALGTGLIKHGHEVMLSSRDTSKLAEWQAEDKGQIGSFSDAAAYGDIVILAVKGAVAKDALDLTGAENLKGKTIIDTTNPISDQAPENGVINFFTDLKQSLMEQLQVHVPEGNFVKAFNSVGSAFMIDPKFDLKPSMFICGNNEDAKKDVRALLNEIGWEVEDMGKVEAARCIEPLCMLWCIPGFLNNQWSHAFKLLKA